MGPFLMLFGPMGRLAENAHLCQKQGSGEPVPEFPAPEDAWRPLTGADGRGSGHVPGTMRGRKSRPCYAMFQGELSTYFYRGVGKVKRMRHIISALRGLRNLNMRYRGFGKFGVAWAECGRKMLVDVLSSATSGNRVFATSKFHRPASSSLQICSKSITLANPAKLSP